jgi:adenosylmethionine-8-amino-7-oxononanoate aminotransferase
MIPLPPGYTRRVRELCTELGVLLIADEVAMGLGRTGTMFACNVEDVVPDFLCLGKGLSGGYLPLAATVTTEKVFASFEGTTFYHGHTFTANPLGCAAALASLELYEQNDLLADVRRKMNVLKDQLKSFWDLPWVGDIRSAGFFAAVELVRNRDTRDPFPPETRHAISEESRKRGLISRGLAHNALIFPALAMDDATLKRLCAILYESIEAVCSSMR